MIEIKAAIFDVGQVLHSYDPKPIHQDIIDTLGISPQAFKENWNNLTIKLELGRLTEVEYWKQFKIRTGSKAILPRESLLVRKYGLGFRIYDDVIDIVKKIKEQGLSVAILSNSIEPHYRYNKRAGLHDEFSVQIFSHQVGLRKPDPRIYELVIAKLGVEPNEALFIDDRDENIEAAKNLGLYGHLFVNSYLLKKDLKDRFGVDLV